MSGTVRAKNVHLLARPCVKAAYAACGCDSAIRVRRSTSSTQVATFYSSLKASFPIAAIGAILFNDGLFNIVCPIIQFLRLE